MPSEFLGCRSSCHVFPSSNCGPSQVSNLTPFDIGGFARFELHRVSISIRLVAVTDTFAPLEIIHDTVL